MRVLSAIFTITILLIGRSTTSTENGNEEQAIGSTIENDSEFIEPHEVSNIVDVFVRDDKEYVFVNSPVNHIHSHGMCKILYNGQQAFVQTVELAEFLAEALSETNLLMDALWVGGRCINNIWYWYENATLMRLIDQKIVQLFLNYSELVKATDRNCLAIAREDHDIPHFPTLTCDALRPFVCERPVSHGNNGSTHPGWITIGKRKYKIFQERVTWEEAMAKCIAYDKKSYLAVLVNFQDNQALGRFLLIGRPSLENAWIGAWYHNYNYVFIQENVILANVTNTEGYPPWRNGAIRKKNGCILFDRHLSNKTLFVEARCERKRPYICYKREPKEQDQFVDILIDEFGYRVYYNKVPWENAKDKCNFYKNKYQAKLAEIREKRIVAHMLYAMGENKTAIQHVWLGGVFNSTLGDWFWDSDKSLVDRRELNWIRNTTYLANVEQYNICLNMDRENSIKAMHYGTVCDFGQHFVCMFPRTKLEQLQKDEANKTTPPTKRKRIRKVIRYG